MDSVHGMPAPCRALCTSLVTAKNSSEPSISCQSASIPRSRNNAIWVTSSSATPPPNDVLLMWTTRHPLRGSAASRRRATASSPAGSR